MKNRLKICKKQSLSTNVIVYYFPFSFEILSVIRIERPDESVIREAMKKLYNSESRVMLLYASK